MDRERVGKLCRAGLWVGSVWCSVRKFVAVPVRRKKFGWVRVVDRVDERMGMVEYGLAKVNEEQKEEVKRFEVGMGVRHTGRLSIPLVNKDL